MYVDSHAHLFKEDFGEDVHDAIVRACDAGVECIVVPGTNLRTSREAIALAEKYDCIYACVGIHPHDVSDIGDEFLKEIESMATSRKVVGIGEIGLDYYYDFSPRDKQIAAFKEQLGIAYRGNLPIVVHTRDSLSETFEIVGQYVNEHPHWRNSGETKIPNDSMGRGVFHCFTGSASDADGLFKVGFYVSYPGIVTFKNSPVVETLNHIGCENILLETDSPYMAPVPLRGKRNEPANIVHIGKKISEVLGIPETEVAKVTSLNAKSLFQIGHSEYS